MVGGARHEARFIVDEVLAVAPGGALPRTAAPAPAAAARAMAARRAAGEPLQYIFGHWPFRRLDLRVDPRVLIPRPETEQVVEVALDEARRLHAAKVRAWTGGGRRGTGSGAIALALATELGAGVVDQVWATDTSAGALEVAAANLEACRGMRQRWQHSPRRIGRRQLADPSARSAARSRRPRGFEPALCDRGRVGGAGA